MILAILAVPLAALAFTSSVKPLPAPVRADLRATYEIAKCPVRLTELRLLTVTHWDFDGRVQTGPMVSTVNAKAGPSRSHGCSSSSTDCASPFANLDGRPQTAGEERAASRIGDVSGSFECRPAVASPCSKGAVSKNWSNHAYGLAIDLNPRREPLRRLRTDAQPGADPVPRPEEAPPRDGHARRGEAFRSIGWGWGGDWSGSTKDYMHFSWNGR